MSAAPVVPVGPSGSVAPVGYAHVAEIMGMAVSLDVRDPVVGTPGLDAMLAWLAHVEHTFSTYRDDSTISRLARGELSLAEAGPEVQHVLLACEALRRRTGGLFDAFAVPAPNGTMLDPSGYVKGWAGQRAADILAAAGLSHFCCNLGGDVIVAGAAGGTDAAAPWAIGIRDPDDGDAVIAVVHAQGDVAVATSGTYERGAHLMDPRSGTPAAPLASATVIGPDLTTTDAFATVAFVRGLDAIDWIDTEPGYEAVLVTRDRRIVASATGAALPSGRWSMTR